MGLIENKIDKNRSIFMWLPSLMTIKYPKGRSFVLAWGFYTLVLKEKANKAVQQTCGKPGC